MSTDHSERDRLILDAALIAFGRYGFSRVKIDDIAQAAGIARTAVYKSFENKAHIFKALAERVHAEAIDLARDALDQDVFLTSRLPDALIARDTHLLRIGHTGPHAEEIADLYSLLADEIARQSNLELEAIVEAAIKKSIDEGGFQLRETYRSERDMARLLRLGLEGIKKEVKSIDEFEQLARQFIAAIL